MAGQDEQEVALTGGNANAVVRIGDTVHRVAGPWTPTVHALLGHLRRRGIDWVPRPLGLDAAGREVLDFLHGEVPSYPLPEWIWDDAVLTDAGRRLRAFHDATRGFDLPAAVWQQPPREPADVICHNDFAPYNLVFDGRRIVGLIDLDMASPGPRAWDAASLAYRLVPLTAESNPDAPALPLQDRARRLRLLCATYGDLEPAAVLALVAPRLEALAAYSVERSAVVPDLAEHARLYRTDAAWVSAHAIALLA